MKQTDDNSSRKTIDKAMRVLFSFSAEEPELTVGELSARLGLHKSVVSRLVSALREWRLLEKDPETQRIRIGEGAYRIGGLYAPSDNLVRVATPHMEQLVARTGQSNHLTVLEGQKFLVVATIESPSSLRVIMRKGERRPLYATAAGKIFLACSEGLLQAVTSGPLEAITPHTIVSPEKLRRVVRRVRDDGIAWNAGESSLGAGAVAAAIHDRTGKVVAVLSTVYPLNVVTGSSRVVVGAATKEAANSISRELGFYSKD